MSYNYPIEFDYFLLENLMEFSFRLEICLTYFPKYFNHYRYKFITNQNFLTNTVNLSVSFLFYKKKFINLLCSIFKDLIEKLRIVWLVPFKKEQNIQSIGQNGFTNKFT